MAPLMYGNINSYRTKAKDLFTSRNDVLRILAAASYLSIRFAKCKLNTAIRTPVSAIFPEPVVSAIFPDFKDNKIY